MSNVQFTDLGTQNTGFPNPLAPNADSVTGGREAAEFTAPHTSDFSPHLSIDYLKFPPNGCSSVLDALLHQLGESLRGELIVSFTMGHRGAEFYSSRATSSDLHACSVSQAACLESRLAKQMLNFANRQKHNAPGLDALRAERDAEFALSMAVPPDDIPGLQCGLVLVFDKDCPARDAAAVDQLLSSIQPALANWLRIWICCRRGKQPSVTQKIRNLYDKRRLLVSLTILCSALALMLVPIPYRPRRSCVVEPLKRTFVSAPLDGRLEKALVRPGDTVTKNQLLGRIDDEQLQWKIVEVQAELEAALKRRDTALASRDGGELRLAQLDQQRIEIQLESLEKDRELLEIRSPRAGVVVQGDWHESEGAPIDRGETLFEIAPLDQMRVEVRLEAEDLASVKAGFNAHLRFDATENQLWSGKLERIDPRGQPLKDQVVFIAELPLENSLHQLRPGMEGKARIEAGTKPLGWILLHRPTNWLIKKFYW